MTDTNTQELAKSFDPAAIEARWYPIWEERGYFKAGLDPKKPSFSIQLPPPNITGILHMGHAFNQTVMDTLTRYHRMAGYNTVWIPGTDHAGIATQIVVERKLEKQGIDYKSLTREQFIEKVWEWQQFSGGTILNQMRRIGDSVDWDRTYFTMDEKLSKVVIETFVRLYEEGLIYRGNRLVNWDPKLQSAVSDLEVESAEENGHMWEIRYPAADGTEGVVVATTRPETLFGDQAVAVNPEDERYTALVGKELVLPLTGRTIPVIADSYVDREFGSGCVKITPAHDFNDFEVGRRHNLAMLNVLTKTARMNDNVPEKYRGMDRYECRKAVVEDLKAAGLLVGIKEHRHMVPRVTRTGEIVEPMLSDQWYMAMSKPAPEGTLYPGKSIGEVGLEAVESGEVNIFPKEWCGVYRQWLENIQDWCISRQLLWGHQIPAWYDEAGNVYVARSEEEAQKQAGEGVKLTRDADVLDTWFSSALVPFSTLGWPEPQGDDRTAYDLYLPSTVLVTGYDIIFFWVARMVMMTKHFTGRVPFHNVYIHGLVRDAEGKKMSKSEGNTLDPLDIIQGIGLEDLVKKNTMGLRQPEKAPQVEKKLRKNYPEGIAAHGADALRFTMAAYATLGRNVNFDLKRAEGYRNFCTKLWNATRFVLMNLPEDFAPGLPADDRLDMSDKWVLTKLNQVAGAMTDNLDHYEMGLAAAKINSFIWDVYCDWFIEIAKPRLNSGDAEQADTARRVLVYVLDKALKLLHPFMPFITEELYQALPGSAETIMTQSWPTFDEAHNWADEEEAFEKVMDYIKAVRTMRTEMNVHPAKKTSMIIETADAAPFQKAQVYLAKFAFATDVTFTKKYEGSTDGMVQVSTHAARGFIPMMELIDRDKELARLNKEKAKAEKEMAMFANQLNNPKFVERAPAALVEDIRNKYAKSQDKLANIEQSIKALG